MFAVDDTPPSTASIAGKVAALTDSAPPSSTGIIWSSTGAAGVASFDNIPGITELSTSPTGCNGAVDGACDTAAILTQYSSPITTPSINRSFYAAGLCKTTINGFSDWYLPAICELGVDGTGICGTPSTPLAQNMQSSLVDTNAVPTLSGPYWSSTEFASMSSNLAWVEVFVTGGASALLGISKNSSLGVRCARAMTN